ncbi:hypothetical protein KFK09_018647 [Dendrobium nobile]|uniref:Uncharacterized protein n=1 Tax=Dendrobium nobile TaxID=94219 RepID=A0A8T3B1S8_DENNO|nr:hypothetical protein KFK09_018647 [Dendrobium nobile]
MRYFLAALSPILLSPSLAVSSFKCKLVHVRGQGIDDRKQPAFAGVASSRFSHSSRIQTFTPSSSENLDDAASAISGYI